MSHNQPQLENLTQLQSVRISTAARARMEHELSEYANFHEVSADVREGIAGRSNERVANVSGWSYRFTRSNRTPMPFIAIAAVLMLSGGASYAAADSLPGDTLYPIKIHLNENVKAAFAVSADAEAQLQADLLAMRVAEAETLEDEGRLSGELATEVNARVAAQAAEAAKANDDADAETRVATDAQIRVALAAYTNVSGNDALLALHSDTSTQSNTTLQASDERASDTSIESDTATMLALEPVSIDTLIQSTDTRIESLREVVVDHKSDIKADVYASYTSTLDEAAELTVAAKAQSEASARETLSTAAELAGKVESALSLLGTVTIDAETGAIIDIDFSTPPPSEPDRSLEVEADAQGAINLNDAAAGLEASSGLSL